MIKKKLYTFGRWVKNKWKALVLLLSIGTALAYGGTQPITPAEIAWVDFTDNLEFIEYQHKGQPISELKNLKGIWMPTEEDFKEVYKYAYGFDLVPWQKLDGTEMSPLIWVDDHYEREKLVPHWEQEFNNAEERGEVEGDIIKGLRKGVRENEVNADGYKEQPISQKRFDFKSWFSKLFQYVYAGVEFSDAFTEADAGGVALVGHTPETGTGWEDLIEVGSCDLSIYGAIDELDARFGGCDTDEGNLCNTADIMSNADYTVEVGQVNGDTGDDRNGLACRLASSTAMYVAIWNEVDSYLYLYDGTCSTLDTGPSIADGSTVTLDCTGNVIDLKDDGVSIASTTDSTHASAGQAGISFGDMGCNSGNDGDQQRLDNFVVTVTAAPPAAAPLIIPNPSPIEW